MSDFDKMIFQYVFHLFMSNDISKKKISNWNQVIIKYHSCEKQVECLAGHFLTRKNRQAHGSDVVWSRSKKVMAQIIESMITFKMNEDLHFTTNIKKGVKCSKSQISFWWITKRKTDTLPVLFDMLESIKSSVIDISRVFRGNKKIPTALKFALEQIWEEKDEHRQELGSCSDSSSSLCSVEKFSLSFCRVADVAQIDGWVQVIWGSRPPSVRWPKTEHFLKSFSSVDTPVRSCWHKIALLSRLEKAPIVSDANPSGCEHGCTRHKSRVASIALMLSNFRTVSSPRGLREKRLKEGGVVPVMSTLVPDEFAECVENRQVDVPEVMDVDDNVRVLALTTKLYKAAKCMCEMMDIPSWYRVLLATLRAPSESNYGHRDGRLHKDGSTLFPGGQVHSHHCARGLLCPGLHMVWLTDSDNESFLSSSTAARVGDLVTGERVTECHGWNFTPWHKTSWKVRF